MQMNECLPVGFPQPRLAVSSKWLVRKVGESKFEVFKNIEVVRLE
jgi:hypothetical protein